jgi:hypothetical protein
MNIVKRIMTGWHFMRWVRLGVAILFAAEALRTLDILMGLAAAFILSTAILNIGCCGSATCSVQTPRERKANS